MHTAERIKSEKLELEQRKFGIDTQQNLLTGRRVKNSIECVRRL